MVRSRWLFRGARRSRQENREMCARFDTAVQLRPWTPDVSAFRFPEPFPISAPLQTPYKLQIWWRI